MSVIEISHLTRNYGNQKGIFDLSLNIESGEVFGFLGPNGAGKTTTIRHLMGFIKPQQGNCRIDGLDCWQQAALLQQEIGYIPGEIAFFNDMSGDEYLKFIAKYRKLEKSNRKQELIERFALDPKGKIKKMSKGMKQKLGIIAAFMHDPKILILDEPTSGLDPVMQNTFVELINEEKAKGKTIIMSSHIFEEVEKTCDRIGIIKDGCLVALDTSENIRMRHVKSFVVTLEDQKQAQEFAQNFQGSVMADDPCKVKVTHKQSLEDIFLNYYGGKK